MPLLIESSATLRGYLSDPSGQPIRHYALKLSWDFGAFLDYFCDHCATGGEIPLIALGETYTDDAGDFSFAIPNVRDDPFFQTYPHAGTFHLISLARNDLGLSDDVLRPSHVSATSASETPLVVVRVSESEQLSR